MIQVIWKVSRWPEKCLDDVQSIQMAVKVYVLQYSGICSDPRDKVYLKIHIFPNLQVRSWKIKLATPISIFNFKWPWQAQFSSYIPQILKKYVFFIDVQMILLLFFDIPYQKSVIWKRATFIFNSRPTYAGNGQKPA